MLGTPIDLSIPAGFPLDHRLAELIGLWMACGAALCLWAAAYPTKLPWCCSALLAMLVALPIWLAVSLIAELSLETFSSSAGAARGRDEQASTTDVVAAVAASALQAGWTDSG